MIVSMEATPTWDFIPNTSPKAHHHYETAFGVLSLRPCRLWALIAAIAGAQAALPLPLYTCQPATNAAAYSTKQPPWSLRLQLRHIALATNCHTFMRKPWEFFHPIRDPITPLAAAFNNTSPPTQTAATNQLLAAGVKAPKMFADTNDVAVATTNHAQQTPSSGMVLAPAQKQDNHQQLWHRNIR